MIDELVKSGYDSDPVKAWKINIDRESALVSTTRITFLNVVNAFAVILKFTFCCVFENACIDTRRSMGKVD